MYSSYNSKSVQNEKAETTENEEMTDGEIREH